MAKKNTKFLFIDTNIYIQSCVLEIDEGDDLLAIKKLRTLLDQDKLILLLPEIVELEIYKKLNNKIEEVEKYLGEYKKKVNTDGLLEEKIKKELMESFSKVLLTRKQNSKKVMEELRGVFSHKNTVRKELKLTPELLLEGYKYFFHQSKPYKNEQSSAFIQNDCLIIELIKKYLTGKKNYTLYICSNNKADFCENPKAIDNFKVSKDISKHFKNVDYSVNLYRLLNKRFRTKIPEKTVEKLDEGLIKGSQLSGAPEWLFEEGITLRDSQISLQSGESDTSQITSK